MKFKVDLSMYYKNRLLQNRDTFWGYIDLLLCHEVQVPSPIYFFYTIHNGGA